MPSKRTKDNLLMDEALIDKIQRDFPRLKIRKGRKFAFRPTDTIIIGPEEPHMELLFLHEVGHALSGHHHFNTGVERLKMEMQAWEKAKELAAKYNVTYDEDVAQDQLDTYRNWLHQKSRCPRCGLTRFETSDRQFHCPKCDVML